MESRGHGDSKAISDELGDFSQFHRQKDMDQIDVFYGFVHLHDVAAGEGESLFGDQWLEDGENVMGGSVVIRMGLTVIEVAAQNGNLVAFFPKLFGEAIASGRRSVVQFVCAFEDKEDFHRA